MVVVQVWESTPGFGDKPFLDTLWSSIDEVCVVCVWGVTVYSFQMVKGRCHGTASSRW